MAIENKWKSSAQSTVNSSLDMDAIEDQIAYADEEMDTLGVRSDWTMQRKMGVAMGIVGMILVVVGVAPMVLDSNDLKGSLSESQEEAPDPLAALFGASTTETATDTSTNTATEPDNSAFADTTTTSQNAGLPAETVSFGGTEDTSIELEPQPQTVDVVLPTQAGDGQFTNMTLEGDSNTAQNTTISSEVDQIIAEEKNIQNGGTPVNLSNSNTGTTDTLGSEFMTANPNVASSSNDTFHASAGLQNTSVKNTQLTNSGPADMALIVFLLSLFIVGGVRYRKELFA